MSRRTVKRNPASEKSITIRLLRLFDRCQAWVPSSSHGVSTELEPGTMMQARPQDTAREIVVLHAHQRWSHVKRQSAPAQPGSHLTEERMRAPRIDWFLTGPAQKMILFCLQLILIHHRCNGPSIRFCLPSNDEQPILELMASQRRTLANRRA